MQSHASLPELDGSAVETWETVKPWGEGVSELRVDYGPGYRIYFGQKGQTLVILLCGGDKRTQDRDIRQAQHYWADYEQREST
jgi:putative addiction module killer protein